MFALVFFFYDVEFLPAEMYFMEIEYSSELVLYTLLERFLPGTCTDCSKLAHSYLISPLALSPTTFSSDFSYRQHP